MNKTNKERLEKLSKKINHPTKSKPKKPKKFITGETMDPWQQEVIEHKGSISLRCGRQTGKSETVSEKAQKFALENDGTTTLVIAASQRQSSLIFEKINAKIKIQHDELIDKAIKDWEKKNPDKTMKAEERREIEYNKGLYATLPTQTKIILNNGSKIYCLPTGKTGAYIRGFTIDLLIADEAAYIPESVWMAIMPMIAVSQKTRGFGWLILLSTPFGKGGFFYNACHDKSFRQFHIKSEDCERIPKEFLRKERARLTKQEYAQEYLAEFVEEYAQIFPTTLIKERMTFISWDIKKDYNKQATYYLGVDVARFGGDENAFIIVEMNKNKKLKIVYCNTTERKSIVDTSARIEKLHEAFQFRKIFIDDNGVGGGLTDLLIEKLGKKRVRGLNNSSKSITGKTGKILKEDLYSNALVLMENKDVEIISDVELLRSLKSVTFEYSSNQNLRIYGNYTHLAEAMVRGLWCIKEKGLKLFLA
ncbi:MAG: terminase large subunit domain-containing protein [Elusimicrobiota bacterium]